MKKQLCLISFLLGVNCFCANNLSSVFQILPEPREVEVFEGKGIMYNELTFVMADPGTPVPVLGATADALPRSRCSGKGLFLRLRETDVPDSPEGYMASKTGRREEKWTRYLKPQAFARAA